MIGIFSGPNRFFGGGRFSVAEPRRDKKRTVAPATAGNSTKTIKPLTCRIFDKGLAIAEPPEQDRLDPLASRSYQRQNGHARHEILSFAFADPQVAESGLIGDRFRVYAILGDLFGRTARREALDLADHRYLASPLTGHRSLRIILAAGLLSPVILYFFAASMMYGVLAAPLAHTGCPGNHRPG